MPSTRLRLVSTIAFLSGTDNRRSAAPFPPAKTGRSSTGKSTSSRLVRRGITAPPHTSYVGAHGSNNLAALSPEGLSSHKLERCPHSVRQTVCPGNRRDARSLGHL